MKLPDRLRLARRLAALVAVLLACLVAHGVTRVLRRPSRWPRRFLGRAARACGARVTVRGTPRPAHVLYVANHQSWLDILAIGGATDAAFVSKAEVGDWPVVGRLADLAGTLYVRREKRSEARGQADVLGDALASGRPAALFAEGATGDGTALLPFKPSLFAAVAGRSGLAVQPVWVDYGAEGPAIAWVGDEGAGANAARVIARRGRRCVTLSFLAPIDAGDEPDRKALASRARAAIDAARAAAYRPAA